MAAGTRLVVDLAQLLRSGASGSAIRRRWLEGQARIAALQRTVVELGFPGSLPDLASLGPVSRGLARGKGSCAVVGQPGAVAAARVWSSLGAEAGVPGVPLRFVTQPGVVAESRVIAMLGPGWVEGLVEEAIARGSRVAVCGVPSEEAVEAPKSGWWVPDAQVGDGRLGVLGAASLLVATLAGVDTAGAVAGAREVLAGADAAAGIDNAPWSLARGLRLAQVELGRDAVVHVAGDARLAAFAEWACRTQAATLAGGDASTSPARALPSTMVAGDEEWIEALARGSRDRVVLLWRAQDAPGVADALARFAGSAGQLVIRVQLPSADARWVGAACALWLRAVACLALLEDRQPGPLRALPAWEAALAGEAG